MKPLYENRYLIVSQGHKLHRILDTQKAELLPEVYEGKKPVEECKRLNESTGAATESGLYNCEVCGQEKCLTPGICEDCLTPPTEKEVE